MDAYDEKYVVPPFGLNNVGAICHFNALLQALLSCTSVVKAVLGNPRYFAQTATGRAFAALVGAAHAGKPEVSALSAPLIAALIADLRVRRPRADFAAGNQSASEGLVMLLDMLEVPVTRGVGKLGVQQAAAARASPLSRLFLHRYSTRIYCGRCRAVVSLVELDHSAVFEMFYLDALVPPVADAAAFTAAIHSRADDVEDYLCPKCKVKSPATRFYQLKLVPEVVVCAFNIYTGARPARFVPPQFTQPMRDPRRCMLFRQVANVIHHGGLGGGHYLAQGLRARGGVHEFNDSSAAPAAFDARGNQNTYLTFYHYAGTVAAQ